MIELRATNGQVLSLAIRNLSPEKLEGQVVKNRLIDGSYHIQTIGEPSKTREFEILANETQVEKINRAEATGEEIVLQIDETIHRGLIGELPVWTRLTLRHNDPGERRYTSALIINLGG